ncbi:substrate-binding periplasmic protein, partial [Chromobacterium vaccinii]|uniref:substrate-binding periplasmic protein n=1 Tax=Chromobacterium vaccinii TaxID=1108595 RepID=UPI003C72C1FA
FFYKKSHIKLPPLTYSWESLKSYSIVGTVGYWYVPIFKEKDLKIEFGNNDENAFKMLSLDRADLVPASAERGWWIIEHEFPKIMQDDFATLDKPIINGEMFLMASKQYPRSNELLEKFNSGLEKIIKNGEYNQIIVKYKKMYHFQEHRAAVPLIEQ